MSRPLEIKLDKDANNQERKDEETDLIDVSPRPPPRFFVRATTDP